jgi:DNA invertase Pin-like site-specific DNA recombinase
MSIDQQIEELKAFAEREKLEIVEFLTEAQTAKIPGRPVFNNLVKLIEKGFANGIVSWNPDRLARNTIDGGKIVYLLDTGKLESLKFPTHWFENTPQGRFMLNIAFGQAKYYVDNLSENVKRGLYFKVRRGEWPSPAPLGYKNDRNTKTVVIDSKPAKLIKEAFRKFAAGEFSSMKEISNFFYRNGITRRNGKALHLNQIRGVLTRTFYYGLMEYHGEFYQGKHKPLITKKLFDVVQKVLEKRYNKKPHKHNFAFTGFIKCGECGSAITAEKHFKFYPRTRGKVSYVYYRCTKKSGNCSQKYIREEKLEEQLREIASKVAISEKWANQLIAWAERDAEKEGSQAKVELAKLKQELKALDQKLNKLLDVYLEETVDTQSYQNKKNEFLEKQQILKEKIQEIQKRGGVWFEPLKEFVFSALRAQKIAREKDNGEDLKIFAKNAGSNYFLRNRRLGFSWQNPYKALAAPASAASATSENLFWCNFTTKLEHILSKIPENC